MSVRLCPSCAAFRFPLILALALGGCRGESTSPPVTPPNVDIPTQLAFTVQPATATAGASIRVAVTVQDSQGNVVRDGIARVTVAITPSTGTTGAHLRGIAVLTTDTGVAIFSTNSIDSAGRGYRLTASSTDLSSATSDSFDVVPGAPVQFVFTSQPTTTIEGRPITPPVVVTAKDSFGNTASAFTGTVTMTLDTSPYGVVLLGMTNSMARGGVATFPDVVVGDSDIYAQGAAVANGYVLHASAGVAATGSSTAFSVGTTGIDYWASVPGQPGYTVPCYLLTDTPCGSVIVTPKVAVIYWSASVIYDGGPAPGTRGTGDQDGSLIGYFLRHLGGSPYFATTQTYYEVPNSASLDSVVRVENNIAYTQFWADNTAPADTAPTDSAVQAEVETALTSGALAYDSSTMYVVFSGPGVDLGGGFGYYGYCGYHWYFTDALGRDVKYAVMPYDFDLHQGAACDALDTLGSPNAPDSAADAEVNVLAHELAEMITDEHVDAWFQNPLNEIGDLCSWSFGGLTPLGGRQFLVQLLWDNEETSQGNPVGCIPGLSGSAARATAVAPIGHPRTAARLHVARETGPHKMLRRRP